MNVLSNFRKRCSKFRPFIFKKKGKIRLAGLADDKLMYLAMMAFVLVSTTTFVMVSETRRSQVKGIQKILWERKEKEHPPIPILPRSYQSFPVVSAQATLIIDLDSGTALYEKNPDARLLPASTTKIVTALVAMDYYNDEDVLVVNGGSIVGRKMGLYKGEEISAGSLLKGLLIYSANDAAEVLAENYEGGREVFIDAMNEKARELSLNNSYFENPTGYDGNGHVSTARDLIRVAEVAMRNPKFAGIVGKESEEVTNVDGTIVHHLSTTNALLGEVEGVLGVKTGWTENARENLVTYIEKDGRRLMIAMLGSQDRFGETKELINWIFENYSWEEVGSP